MNFSDYDAYIVGAGFFGATLAERLANNSGRRVLLIERRRHIGGNAYSEKNAETGIEIHKYGAHIFHTSNEEVWNYIRQFSEFTDYKHRVYTAHKGNVFPMPINLATICQYFGRHMGPAEARALIAKQAAELDSRSPGNLEDKAISLIGRPLYEAFIRGYTLKQWQTDPRNLPESIITRLPVRYTFNNRYFNDLFEGLPVDGYTSIFRKMLKSPQIDICLGVDYFDIREMIPSNKLLIFTGPIDRYFNYRAGELSWRTLDLHEEVAPVEDFQGTSVMNYADEDAPFTRILEFRHFHPERNYQKEKTLIVREYSRFAGRNDEPYYPVQAATDTKTYNAYRELASRERNVIFGGRLGAYKYLDMHQAIGAALKTYDRIQRNKAPTIELFSAQSE